MLIIETPENLFSSPNSELQGTEMLQLPERSAEWDSNGNPLISRTLIPEDSNQQLFSRILIRLPLLPSVSKNKSPAGEVSIFRLRPNALG